MQIWDYRILTLKIPLKFVGLCDKHASLVKPYIDTQYSINSNMDFFIMWSQPFDFLRFNSTINLNN